MKVTRTASSLSALGGLALLALGFPLACASAPPPPPPAPFVAPPPAPPTPTPQASAAPAPVPPPAAKPARFAVATENASATAAAMEILRRGGSAADAAIAALLSIGVAQPVSSGLGGGGFAMVWDAKAKKATVIDFRETAPRGIKPSDYDKRGDLGDKRAIMTGVPGEPAGLEALHARLGKLALADDARPAEKLASEGFPVSEHLARTLGWNMGWMPKAVGYSLFLAGGKPVAAGTVVKNPALAQTLRVLASEGAKAFYQGTVAADVLATARAGGSRMTAKDLADYKVETREPLTTQWEGYTIETMPPPSAGGVMLLETLHMHDAASLQKLGYDSGAYLHVLAETFRGAIADRVRMIGDPAFVKMDIANMTSPERMKKRLARIALDKTTPAEKFTLPESGTSHVVVVDGDGNVVSVTSTVNNMFGAKLPTKGGFLLNDELDDFTPIKIEKQFGVTRGPNEPRGGARPVSSMTPTIVLKDGEPVFALGGSGGMRIATGVTQVTLAHLLFGRTAEQSVTDPRIDTPPTGGLLVDSTVPKAVVEDLEKRGEVVDQTKPNFSAVQAASITPAPVRTLEPAADPRKGGVASVE